MKGQEDKMCYTADSEQQTQTLLRDDQDNINDKINVNKQWSSPWLLPTLKHMTFI